MTAAGAPAAQAGPVWQAGAVCRRCPRPWPWGEGDGIPDTWPLGYELRTGGRDGKSVPPGDQFEGVLFGRANIRGRDSLEMNGMRPLAVQWLLSPRGGLLAFPGGFWTRGTWHSLKLEGHIWEEAGLPTLSTSISSPFHFFFGSDQDELA